MLLLAGGLSYAPSCDLLSIAIKERSQSQVRLEGSFPQQRRSQVFSSGLTAIRVGVSERDAPLRARVVSIFQKECTVSGVREETNAILSLHSGNVGLGATPSGSSHYLSPK